MMIIGADYHPGFQQIAFVDTDRGELQERRLQHREEAEKFYRDLAARLSGAYKEFKCYQGRESFPFQKPNKRPKTVRLTVTPRHFAPSACPHSAKPD